MNKIYIIFAMLIVSISTLKSTSAEGALSKDQRRDVIAFIHFAEARSPETVNQYKDGVGNVFAYCAEQSGPIDEEENTKVAQSLEQLIIEANENLLPQAEIEDKLSLWKKITLGFGGPNLKYPKEIRNNILRYLDEVHASVEDRDYPMCIELLANFFELAPNTAIAQRN